MYRVSNATSSVSPQITPYHDCDSERQEHSIICPPSCPRSHTLTSSIVPLPPTSATMVLPPSVMTRNCAISCVTCYQCSHCSYCWPLPPSPVVVLALQTALAMPPFLIFHSRHIHPTALWFMNDMSVSTSGRLLSCSTLTLLRFLCQPQRCMWQPDTTPATDTNLSTHALSS